MNSIVNLLCHLTLSLVILSGSGVAAGENLPPQFEPPRVQEPTLPGRTVKVTEFGAVPDGRTLNTRAIEQGLAALAERGGGRLVFPPGIWLTGPIGLKSKTGLHLEEGALIQFTPDFAQYPARELLLKEEKLTVTTSPIYGEDLHDVAITGRGVFDGNGQAWRPVKHSKMTERQWKQLLASGGVVQAGSDEIWWPSTAARVDRRPCLMKLLNCRRVLFEGVTFQNSPGWNLNPTLCEDVTVRNVVVRNPWYAQNGDGLDLEHCRNVIVRDSRFDVGDDAICLKAGRDARGRRIGVPTENVLIENCIVYHGHGGFTIGSEMSAGVRNVRVDNCLFIGTDVGLRFKSSRGRGGIVEKIFIRNIRMTDIATDAIGFDLHYGGRAPTEGGGGAEAVQDQAVAGEETPQFRDIFIEDVICRGARRGAVVQGLPEMPIRGIVFRNISLQAEEGLVCDEARDITLQRVEILNSRGPVVSIANSRDIRIDRLTWSPGAQPVLRATGARTSGIVIRDTALKHPGPDLVLTNGAVAEAVTLQH